MCHVGGVVCDRGGGSGGAAGVWETYLLSLNFCEP